MLGVEATCEQCGLIYVKQRCNQRYCCEECKKAGSRRKAREYYYKTDKYKKKQKAKKKEGLSDINQKARAAGMTYGKYMAQEYGKQVKVERRKENV